MEDGFAHKHEDAKDKEIQVELDDIHKRVDKLIEKYPKIELAFLASVPDKEGRHSWGHEGLKIHNEDRFRLFLSLIQMHYQKRKEEARFNEFIRLGKFKVICTNDSAKESVLEHFKTQRVSKRLHMLCATR